MARLAPCLLESTSRSDQAALAQPQPVHLAALNQAMYALCHCAFARPDKDSMSLSKDLLDPRLVDTILAVLHPA